MPTSHPHSNYIANNLFRTMYRQKLAGPWGIEILEMFQSPANQETLNENHQKKKQILGKAIR